LFSFGWTLERSFLAMPARQPTVAPEP